ncbi:hypothetical protein LXL04_032500 [Taraxacum kok-saghyz]
MVYELHTRTIDMSGTFNKHLGVFDMSSDQRLRLGPRTRSVVCAFDSGRRTRTPDSVRRFASDSVRPKKSQTEFLPVISDSVRGLMSQENEPQNQNVYNISNQVLCKT